MTEEQKKTGRQFEARAMAAIHDPEKFDQVMAEFNEWKAKEGIKS